MSERFSFPQYAKTDNRRVIEAINDAMAAYREFQNAAVALSERYTGKPNQAFRRGNWITGAGLVGLSAEHVKHMSGQWTKPVNGITRPYKSNPAYEMFAAVQVPEARIPGRPSMAFGDGYMGPGNMFVLGGFAYSRFGFRPDSAWCTAYAAESGWVEILPSEYYARREVYVSEDK